MDGPKPIVPLRGRYASKEMRALFPLDEASDFRYTCSPEMRTVFSDEAKYGNWRKAWVVLAEREKELGLPFTDRQIAALKEKQNTINHDRAAELERKMKHDVMAYLTEYKEQVEPVCPGAGGILHTGATSCYITDHEELAAMRNGIDIVYKKVQKLGELADRTFSGVFSGNKGAEYRANLKFALQNIDHARRSMRARGAKGTTGTQASYLELFNGDHGKVKALDQMVSEDLGFDRSYTITGQTYPRIVDYHVLSSIGLLAEAMKQLPSTDEDSKGLLRRVQKCANAAATTASVQWLERSLDDSSERRIIIPEAFYAIDRALDDACDKFSRRDLIYLSKDIEEKPEPDLSKDTDAMNIIARKTANAVDKLHNFATLYRDVVCAAFTHYQFAQPTTHGKRIDLWGYNFVLALNEIETVFAEQKDAVHISEDVRRYFINSKLNGAAVAASKMAHDNRLLQHDMELNEPFAREQVGSTAMGYKKNPMKNERENGLSRVKLRLLDHEKDYAYLATDAVLELVLSTLAEDTPAQKGFTVHEATARGNLMKHMPFMVTENLIMEGVKRGLDRQELHKVVHDCMLKARDSMDSGRGNNMLDLLAEQELFRFADLSEAGRQRILNPYDYVGRSREQVDDFGEIEVKPIRERYASFLGAKGGVQV